MEAINVELNGRIEGRDVLDHQLVLHRAQRGDRFEAKIQKLPRLSRDSVENLTVWIYVIMPTVHRWNGYRFAIHTNDHRPSHIHVIRGKNEAEGVFALNCPDGPPEFLRNYGFSFKEAQQVAQEIESVLASLCRKWKQIHDRY